MLVLSRKIGDSILVGQDIEVSILEIHGGEVRLGFKAPKEVVILRKEIVDEIEAQNKKSSGSLNPNVLGEVLQHLKKEKK